MVAVHTTDLIDSAAAEAFIQLAKTTDRFERYENPHAQRIAAIADEMRKGISPCAPRSRIVARGRAVARPRRSRDGARLHPGTGPLSRPTSAWILSRHPVIGEREASRVGADRAAQLLVRWHHEWWNGAGYPDALRREEIPLAREYCASRIRMQRSYRCTTIPAAR